MNIIPTLEIGRCEAMIDALRAELGGVLAERVIEAEAADLLWQSRIHERYLGQHIDAIVGDDGSFDEVSRMAFLSFLDDGWHVGICLVDGEGGVVKLLWSCMFGSVEEAQIAFIEAR